MKTVDAIKETFDTFLKEIDKIEDAYTFSELDAIEGRAVRALQLMEVQIGDIGAELYSIIKQRRAMISLGKLHKENEEKLREIAKEEGPFFKEEKPVRKKRTTKKSSNEHD